MGSGTHFSKFMGSQESMEPMLTEPLILISQRLLLCLVFVQRVGKKKCTIPKIGYLDKKHNFCPIKLILRQYI